MNISHDIKIGFDDVLIVPKRSKLRSRSEVTLERNLRCPHSGATLSGIPIIAANMDTVGTLAMSEALAEHKMFVALDKYTTSEDLEQRNSDFTFVTSGSSDEDIIRLNETSNRKNICLDVANGYSESFLSAVKRVREANPDAFILAGNVATPEMTQAILLAGASCVKIGIGPGSSCTTRLLTGVGYPQLSAIIECADAAHGLNGHICADGGCRYPADVAKAFAAGADMVMLGGMLAGTDQSHGDRILNERGQVAFIEYRGMSSHAAMKDHKGVVSPYRASEGKVVKVPYKGDVHDVVHQILGGLRSTCTYIGAGRIKDMPKCASFVRTREHENRVFSQEDFRWWER